MGNKFHKLEDFEDLLQERTNLTQKYISLLYFDRLKVRNTSITHDQLHCIGKHREEKPILAFIGENHIIQAWDFNGISTVTAKDLAKPITHSDVNDLKQKGFSEKQIKDAKLVVSKLNSIDLNIKYTTGIAHCITYEPVCYIHNDVLCYSDMTALVNSEKYDPHKMTSIKLGGTKGNNNINKHCLLNLIRPFVMDRILSKKVRITFETPPAQFALWKIEDFMNENRFMVIEELKKAFPNDVTLLSKENIVVEYHSNRDETIITLPYLFYIMRNEIKKMVVVPNEIKEETMRLGERILEASLAVEMANSYY